MSPPIFMHVPKTAGSTLRTLITSNYESHQVLSLYGSDQKVLTNATANVGKLSNYSLIQGHVPYGIHRALGLRAARYFTFMRDPVERFISDVAMGVRHESHGFHQLLAAPGLTYEQRLENALELTYYRNNMTQYFSGSFFTEAISMGLLNTAIDNLWGAEFVGLTEDFEASMLIMAKKLGWHRIIPQKSNVRPDGRLPLPAELYARVKNELAYDYALYTVAQEHYSICKRQYGELLTEAAGQLAELMRKQSAEHPQAQYGTYLVGQPVRVPLNEYDDLIVSGSPLARWLST